MNIPKPRKSLIKSYLPDICMFFSFGTQEVVVGWKPRVEPVGSGPEGNIGEKRCHDKLTGLDWVL